MKNFYKISAIIALTALIFGAAFSIAGICVGGTVEAAGNLVEVYGIHGLHFHFPFFWIGSDREVSIVENTIELDEGVVELEEDIAGEFSESKRKTNKVDGSGKADKGQHTGKTHEVELYYSEDIKELEWDISCASVTVLPGEEFAVWGDNLNQYEFQSYVKNGVWYLEYDQDNTWGWDWENGLEIPEWEDAEICITIPAGTIFEEASITLETGNAVLEGMAIESAELNMGAGDVVLKNVELLEEGYIEIGMGTLTFQKCTGRDVEIDCGMGTVKGTVQLEGESEIECGVGDVDLKLTGKETDYNYEVSCAMGSIKIGKHHSYTGISDVSLMNDAKNSIYLECGLGNIKLQYEE